MRINSFQVVNYKSFADSGQLFLKPGFNVIVGRNNVGKTALAEAVALRFSDKPYRSLSTVPTVGAQPDPQSKITLSAGLESNELVQLLADEMPVFWVRTSHEYRQTGQRWVERVLTEGATLQADFRNGSVVSARLSPDLESRFPLNTYLQLRVDSSGSLTSRGTSYNPQDTYPELAKGLANKFSERLYSLTAVRFGIDENLIGTNRELAPDASNLVQVLDLLEARS